MEKVSDEQYGKRSGGPEVKSSAESQSEKSVAKWRILVTINAEPD